MAISASYPFCIATVVTTNAIEAMLEAGGEGTYKDTHPWLVAKEFFKQAREDALLLPILFASMEDDSHSVINFSHWSTVDEIEVVELHRATWDTRCHFTTLRKMNPIFEPIDSPARLVKTSIRFPLAIDCSSQCTWILARVL